MFDPTHGVVFDLNQGVVRPAGAERAVLVPAAALSRLTEFLDDEAARALGRALGASAGAQVAEGLGGVAQASVAALQDLTDALAGRIALAGLGVLATETWGKTLVVVVENCPLKEKALVSAMVEGLFHAATGRAVSACVVDDAAGALRVLVGSEALIARARAALSGGQSFSALMRVVAGTPS